MQLLLFVIGLTDIPVESAVHFLDLVFKLREFVFFRSFPFF